VWLAVMHDIKFALYSKSSESNKTKWKLKWCYQIVINEDLGFNFLGAINLESGQRRAKQIKWRILDVIK